MLERFPPYPGLADSVERSGNGIGAYLCAGGEAYGRRGLSSRCRPF